MGGLRLSAGCRQLRSQTRPRPSSINSLGPGSLYGPTGARVGERDVFYSLTSKGGCEWEHIAQPRWQDFFTQCYSADDVLVVECISSEKLREVRRWLSLCWGVVFDSQSEATVEHLVPWKANYWKTLERGVRATFSSVVQNPAPNWDARIRGFCTTFTRWHRGEFTSGECDLFVPREEERNRPEGDAGGRTTDGK